MDMDIGNNIIRGMSTSSSRISLRESSTHLITSLSPYHKRMEIQNNPLNKDVQEPIDSSQLSYASNKEQIGNLVRRATNNSS